MKCDRKAICDIMSKMFDNPDSYDIYPTGVCYDELEAYVEEVRALTLGWAIADTCCDLDAGTDPRKKNIPEMLGRARKDLGGGVDRDSGD